MEAYIGVVTHYFNHLGLAVLSLTGELKIGEVIHIVGHTTDFYQENWSMEVNHHQIEAGRPGDEVAMRVLGTVRRGDKVYLAPEAKPMKPEEIQQPWPDPWDR